MQTRNPVHSGKSEKLPVATATVVNPAFVGVTAVAVPVEFEG